MSPAATPADDPVSGTVAHVFVDDLDAPELHESDRRHLLAVLRLRPGQPLTASDGRGGVRRCRMGDRGALETCGEVLNMPRPQPALTVGVALTKGARLEVAVQKLTELGIERIVPFVAARSVLRWDGERAEHHRRRLGRIAREAAMQSRRAHLPVLEELSDPPTLAGRPGAALCQRGGRPPTLDDRVVLVGPEGGWAPEELALGLPCIGLGPHVLRAETAALAVAAVLVALRDGVVVATTGDRTAGVQPIAQRGGAA